jgi:hypothetical protein
MVCAVGTEFASGRSDTATAMVGVAARFISKHPSEKKTLLDLVANLADAIPQEIMEAEGINPVSASELRYRFDHG